MKKAVEIFVGIDVSKAWLDVAVHEQKETTRFRNDAAGIASLMKALKKLKPRLIVLEPTGGFEMLGVAELSQAGLPVAVVNGKRVRDFAKATGRSPRQTSWMPGCWPTLQWQSDLKYAICEQKKRSNLPLS